MEEQERNGVYGCICGGFIFLLSYSLSRTRSSAPLHHLRNPLFSTKNGQNQFQVLSISPSHHLINPLFSISILQFDLTIGFVLLCRTNISSGEVLKQKAFKHADLDASNVEVRHAQGFHNVEREKNHDAYLSDDLFDANLTPLGWKQS
ncbi:hypothetical protein P8452_14816 [Trifolium repens]|nr:hypothetical protein P8452_14816 [Trifolium repens]